MKTKSFMVTVAMLLLLPTTALALQSPKLLNLPRAAVDTYFYPLNAQIPKGSKLIVSGGEVPLSPVIDGNCLDPADGQVSILLPLGQNQINTFFAVVDKSGQLTEPVKFEIIEKSFDMKTTVASEGQLTWNTPNSSSLTLSPVVDNPSLDPIENPVESDEYQLTGFAPIDTVVYVRNENGMIVSSSSVNKKGAFKVMIPLKLGAPQLFNVQAIDAYGNRSVGVPIFIQSISSSSIYADVIEKKSAPENSNQVQKTSFVDIEGHWAKDYIEQLYIKGIVSGKTNTQFDPDAEITRAELTKMALNTFGYLVDTNWRRLYFKDVPLHAWHNPYVGVAKRRNIVEGFVDLFKPDTSITRAAAMKVILEASGMYLGHESSYFADVDGQAWFNKYVAFAQQKNIVQGYEGGVFAPERSITRAEVAKIIAKILEL